MRLIDIDPIIKDKETLSNAFEIVMDSMTGKCLIECTAPIVQAVPIEVLDKIRDEIDKELLTYSKDVENMGDSAQKIRISLGIVRKIIDKYREGKE